ncbi:roquin-1-like isoform X2 [Acropora palmata]
MPIQTPQWTEFLQCPICTKDFDEISRQPISLGCGHTMCVSCLSKLPKTQCPFDQAVVETDISKLPFNYALLQLVGVQVPDDELPEIESVKENADQYRAAKHAIEDLAVFLKPVTGSSNGMVNGTSNGNGCNVGLNNGNGNSLLTRPMQRKLVTLVNCQLAEADGRTRAMRAARSLGERTVTELILLHQNQQQLSSNLWSAVRNRGCQFLGPAMQEEALKLILLALEGGEALSRKVLVLFVVQKLESQFPQASKTSIGHVVQLLYRASGFKVEKKNNESSLMQLKEQFRTYDALRKEHDAQIVQIAMEAGLRILPDQWSSLLYGDLDHKSHMQSIIDKLQSPASFSQSIQELVIALQRSGDPGDLCQMRKQFEFLSQIDASPEALCPDWSELEQAMASVHTVVHGLVKFSKVHGKGIKSASESPQPHNGTNRFKTNLCRDFLRGGCPRGNHCTFAHSEEEQDRYRKSKTRVPRPTAVPRGPGPVMMPDQYSPHGSIENGCDSSPTSTHSPTSVVNGSARSSPHYSSGDIVQTSSGFGGPPQVSRRDSHDQIHMMTQRMKQVSIQSQLPMYQNGTYHDSRFQYDQAPSSYNERSLYFGGYYSATPHSNSYPNVVSRGKDGTVGIMTTPCSSPLTIQDEAVSKINGLNGMNGLNGLNGLNGINGMNGVTNGHVDHHHSVYNGRTGRPRRDIGSIHSQPPGTGSYPRYDTMYGYPSDPTGYYSGQAECYSIAYPPRAALSYEPVQQIMGYSYPRPYVSRKPYIPGSDLCDEFGAESSSPRNSDTASEFDSILSFGVNRKDTTLSSASSGVSSGSPLSHSPAASQSSNSSMSPRQQSPVGWQHGSENGFNINLKFLEDDGNVPLPPPGLTNAKQIWGLHHGTEMGKRWSRYGIEFEDWSR